VPVTRHSVRKFVFKTIFFIKFVITLAKAAVMYWTSRLTAEGEIIVIGKGKVATKAQRGRRGITLLFL
jgi:hypothetical protein